MRSIVLGAAFVLSTLVFTQTAWAKSPIGSWKGSGVLQPNGGQKERVSCRATVRKAPARGAYDAVLRCATSAGIVTQRSRLRKVGKNSYRGSFHNAKYNARGTVSSTVRGNRQSVTMRSNKGRGWLKLRR